MSRMSFFQILAVFPMLFLLGACATSEEYASVIEKKMEMVRHEEREPITTLALVNKQKVVGVDAVDQSVAPQDVETAAGVEDSAPVVSHFN